MKSGPSYANAEPSLTFRRPMSKGSRSGMSRVLAWYHLIGYDSFNLAMYSGELNKEGADRVNLAMITRTAMTPFYRSDSMHLERLHWEAAVDRTPEDVAADVRKYFSGMKAASA